MKILLTGAVSMLHWDMVGRLERDGHRISLLGRLAASAATHTNAILHDMSPNHPKALQVIKTGAFDVIVFFFSCHSIELQQPRTGGSALIDTLFQYQVLAKEHKASQFILVTDARVFGAHQEGSETETPIPDTQEGILMKTAEDCMRFIEADGPRALLIRVTDLYSTDLRDGTDFLSDVRECAANQRPLLLHGTEDSPCDFLHADDFALFLNMAIEGGMEGTVHLNYAEDRTYRDAVRIFSKTLPGFSAAYTQERVRGTLLHAQRAHIETGWVPRHDWMEEFDEIAGDAKKKRETLRKVSKWLKEKPKGKLVPLIEVGIFGAFANYMTYVVEQYSLFRFIDFWLLFVILMGTIHGTFIGLCAATMTCILYGVEWVLKGNDAYMLLMNVDNWLPFVTYLMCGGLFGYMHESSKTKLQLLEHEKIQHDEEAKFLESMFEQLYSDRNKLQEQVMRSRDSYGRIYNIARELDTLQPEQVFLSTLNVLEDTMQNKSVALYSCAQGSSFIRLVVHSRKLSGQLTKSLDITTLPLLAQCLQSGELFMNTTLEPNYPVFAAAVLNEGVPIAMVALWEVAFERQTLYHRNLFNVVVGLVQSSMIRAVTYYGASADVYIENTILLTDRAFRKTMEVHRSMRKQHASSFLLLRVCGADDSLSVEMMDQRLRRAMRNTDICGRLDNGVYYALMPQASLDNLPQIEKRFASVGLSITVAAWESIDV